MIGAAIVALVAIGVKFYFFRFYPIYSDEISYHANTTRYLLDGHQHIVAWAAACISTFAMPLPFLMRLAAYVLSSLGTLTDFGVFRLIAIAILLLGIGCFVFAARNLKLSFRSTEVTAVVLLLVVFIMSISNT